MSIAAISALAALAGVAQAIGDTRSFAIQHFKITPVDSERLDPIVNPNGVAPHVHNFLGASAISSNVTYEKLQDAECTDVVIEGDNSLYWFPQLYYMDCENGTYESVPLVYANVYYFFEASDDKIMAFPEGLKMVTGDVNERQPPAQGCTGNQDPSHGDIQNVRITCPRDGNAPDADVPSWVPGSNGLLYGQGDPNNSGEGCGFPDKTCDGFASPLRYDVHFPSCYNPAAGPDNYKENMAWPTDAGGGKNNCPPGWIHVPHIFYEVYWNTPLFQGRWPEGHGYTPWITSNGDITAFSLHADFMNGWVTSLLQHFIDTCDAGEAAMDKCEGAVLNIKPSCTIAQQEVKEQVLGTMTALPGNNPPSGWWIDPNYTDLSPPACPTPLPFPGSGAGQSGGSGPSFSTPTASPSHADAAGSPPTPAPTPTQTSNGSGAAQPPNGGGAAQAPNGGAPAGTQAGGKSPNSTKSKPCKASTIERTTTSTSMITSTQTVTQCATTTTLTMASSSASAQPTDAPGNINGFVYVGCFQDTNDRVLTGDKLPSLGRVSVDNCTARCKSDGFSLAGVEYGGQCFCGNQLEGSSMIDESNCQMKCEGNADQMCGGGLALGIWSTTGMAGVAGVPGVPSQQDKSW